MGALDKVDDLQQRQPALALPLAVFKRFGEHGGSRLAANISYYSFFSVFPLMLSFVTILSIVLENRPKLRQDLLNGAIGQIPVLGSELGGPGLSGSVWQVILGVALALWAGMGAVNALQFAVDEVWDIPIVDRAKFVGKRWRALVVLVVLALGVAASVFLTNLAAIFNFGAFATIAGFLGNAIAYVGVMLAIYWVLPSIRPSMKEILPGAVVAGIVVAVIQALGFYIMRHWIAGASDTYGTFASVIALLSFFFLVGRVVLLGAELNAVLAHQTTPRSLSLDSPATDGDRRSVIDDAERIQRDPRLGSPVVTESGLPVQDTRSR